MAKSLHGYPVHMRKTNWLELNNIHDEHRVVITDDQCERLQWIVVFRAYWSYNKRATYTWRGDTPHGLVTLDTMTF